MITKEDIEAYNSAGFLHIRGVFSRNEIAAFAKVGRRHFGSKTGNVSLFNIRGLSEIWGDSRLLTTARQILGEDVTYFFESSYSRYVFNDAPKERAQHLHHDAKGMPENLFNRLHSAHGPLYPAVRFGIYFQDYTHLSGALKVSPGSHKIDTSGFDQSTLPFLDVPLREGDVVCFSPRTLHSALALRLRDDPNSALSPLEEARIYNEHPEAFLPLPAEREAVFIDYAARNELADLYIKSRSHHIGAEDVGISAKMDIDAAFRLADENNVVLRVDKLVVDCALQIFAAMRDKRGPSAIAPLLIRLPQLVRRNREFSTHFRLFDGNVDDDSLQSGLALYKVIAPRIAAQQKSFPKRALDHHMSD